MPLGPAASLLNLGQLLRRAAHLRGDGLAMADDERRMSWNVSSPSAR